MRGNMDHELTTMELAKLHKRMSGQSEAKEAKRNAPPPKGEGHGMTMQRILKSFPEPRDNAKMTRR